MGEAANPSILTLEQRAGGLAVLWMNDPGAPVNMLKRALIEEFEDMLSTIEGNPGIKVLVFASGKADTFVAGADLDMLLGIKDAQDGEALSAASQGVQRRIAALKPATVAAIHGACLGGGLELALAFDGRMASDHERTRLGLPEVRLGLLPGGGGTCRLPALVGVERALDLLLSGRQVNARYARHIGLVDECVAKEILVDAAAGLGRELANRRRARSSSPAPLPPLRRLRSWALGGNPIGRSLIFDQARKRTLKRTRGNYPAPVKVLEVVETGLKYGARRGESAEAAAFGKLVVTPEARQLIQLFLAGNKLGKGGGDLTQDQGRPHPVRKVCVLGAGLMGAGIAHACLEKAGAAVRLKDIGDENLSRGLRHIRDILDERVKRRSITPLRRAELLGKLTATLDYSGFENCQLVVEAVFEDLALKRKMVEEVERHTGPETILATNTSALPIAQIAARSTRPQNIIGMHYFSPVERMPLLEVVAGEKTAPWVTATCAAFGRKQGKTVITVRDGPGFYTSRILGPYINEAMFLLAEGAPIDQIDRAMLDFGYPLGPMALLDEVGVDVGQKVAHTLSKAFGDRMIPAPCLDQLVSDGRLGKKNGHGLYAYRGGGKTGERQVDRSVYPALGISPNPQFDSSSISERCGLQMVNEAVYCLAEGIITSPSVGDVGAVLGLGFPPFRGGPFRYLDALGAGRAVERLNALADRHGARFKPAPLLLEHAASGRSFHDDPGP